MDKTAFFALAFMYPYPGHSENLLLESKKLLDEPEGKLVQNFAESLNSLSLSEQEELYTRTLDLNPMAAPYVGYQIWGESYKRGEFMAALNHEMIEDNVELDGELPDHLVPVLRYLTIASSPLPELLEVLAQSVEKMHQSLKKEDVDNPFLYLFEAIARTFNLLQVIE